MVRSLMNRRNLVLVIFLTSTLSGVGCLPPPATRPIYDPAKIPKNPQVEIRDNLLILNQPIFFEFDKDRILPVSFPILDEVVRILRNHAEIAKVRIEGHTDNVGAPAYNLSLSDRRARSVVTYLRQKGVEARRLRSVVMGATQPIAQNETEEGRALNRRVVFAIEEWKAK